MAKFSISRELNARVGGTNGGRGGGGPNSFVKNHPKQNFRNTEKSFLGKSKWAGNGGGGANCVKPTSTGQIGGL